MDKKYLKDILILLGVIIVAAIGARMLGGGETLDEYAKKNGITTTNNSSVENTNDMVNSTETNSNEGIVSNGVQNNSNQSSTNATYSTNSNSENKNSKNTSSNPISSVSSEDSSASSEASSLASTEDTPPTDMVVYEEGFYYEPISNEVFKRISGISYPVDCTVELDELRYIGLKYVDFNGDTQDGEMICNETIAQDLVEIFYELYKNGYQLESVKLIDEFDGDDIASMEANNTSCFNYRVVEGTTKLSNHAYGLAVDINPFYNPYITYPKDGSIKVSPEGSEKYADRALSFPYKIDENDLAYKLFKQHGFTWGGNWNSVKDYQHFERAK